MRAPRSTVLALVALASSACTDAWRQVTYLEGLRLLAIHAEPPDLSPGETTQLDAVVLDTRDPSRANTLVFFACDPDPVDPDQTACAQYTTLQSLDDGTTIGDPTTLPAGVRLLGVSPVPGQGDPVVYQSPADVFSSMAADDIRRTRGVLAILLVMAIAAPPPATQQDLQALLLKVQAKQVDSLLALKRLRISENPEKNHNPVLEGVLVGGELWGRTPQPAKVHPGTAVELEGAPAAGTSESYSEYDSDGNLVQKTEPLILSWFATSGDLDYARTLYGNDATVQRLTLPFVLQKLPEDRLVTLFVVLRDGRGGVDSLSHQLYLCDPFRPAPTVTAIDPPAGRVGTQVKISGAGLDALLDVKVGSAWLADGKWDGDSGAYVGTIPANLAPGLQSVMPRGQGCAEDPVAVFEVTATPP
jgi:hypothetical protein